MGSVQISSSNKAPSCWQSLPGLLTGTYSFNTLAPGKFEWNFRHVIFKQIFVIDGWGISCEIAITWMSLDFTDDQSTLVQVMAWCRQATSHYLNQCWPWFLLPYGITRPQWVLMKSLQPIQRLDTNRWNLSISENEMQICTDFTRMRGYQSSNPNNDHQVSLRWYALQITNQTT